MYMEESTLNNSTLKELKWICFHLILKHVNHLSDMILLESSKLNSYVHRIVTSKVISIWKRFEPFFCKIHYIALSTTVLEGTPVLPAILSINESTWLYAWHTDRQTDRRTNNRKMFPKSLPAKVADTKTSY